MDAPVAGDFSQFAEDRADHIRGERVPDAGQAAKRTMEVDVAHGDLDGQAANVNQVPHQHDADLSINLHALGGASRHGRAYLGGPINPATFS